MSLAVAADTSIVWLHNRARVLVPDPHVTLHVLQAVQSDHVYNDGLFILLKLPAMVVFFENLKMMFQDFSQRCILWTFIFKI